MNSTPFVIKYRPKTIEDFIGDEMLMTTLRGFVEKKFIPNICIYGSNGVGKTCIIECLIKKLYHPNNRGAIIEFSTCDDRGIKIMEQLDFFNKKKITFEEGYIVPQSYCDEVKLYVESAFRYQGSFYLIL